MALHCNAHVFALKCQHCTGTMTTIFRLITLLDSLFGIRISFSIKNKKKYGPSCLYIQCNYYTLILSRWKNKNKQTKNEWPKIAKTSIKRVSRRVRLTQFFSVVCWSIDEFDWKLKRTFGFVNGNFQLWYFNRWNGEDG